ncbi:hypothetical protein ACG3SL_06635 [Sphingomonas sp. CJ20]
MPTTLDMAEEAEAIVVAEVVGERRTKEPWDGVVLTKPIALLKGAAMPPQVEIAGAGLAPVGRGRVWRSDPQELRRANRGAMIGGCVRYTFARGMKLLLFLVRDEKGQLVPFRSPFARDSEDVESLDSLWVKAVREYVALSALPKGERRDRLRARADALRNGDSDDRAIAADMYVELDGTRAPNTD